MVVAAIPAAGAGCETELAVLNVFEKRRFMMADPAADEQRAYVRRVESGWVRGANDSVTWPWAASEDQTLG